MDRLTVKKTFFFSQAAGAGRYNMKAMHQKERHSETLKLYCYHSRKIPI